MEDSIKSEVNRREVYRYLGLGRHEPDERTALLVEESVMSAIIDRFGKDVESAPVDATHARVHVTVAASPVFFGWLAQFGTAVRLEAPSALSRQYADYLRGIADSY